MSIFDWQEDTITADEAVARGRRAEQLLSDPVLLGALADAERTFLDEWYNAKTTQEREAAHAKVHALSEVRTRLVSYAEDAVVMGQRL